jgi:chromosome segregation ATPase
MLDPSSIENIAYGAGALTSLGLVVQQIWKKIRLTNSSISVDTQISSGTIEIIKLLREQNAVAAVNTTNNSLQYEALIASNATRYRDIAANNDSLYKTINELQLKINDLNSKIGEYQIDNKNLKAEITLLHNNNVTLTDQVIKLTTEINKLRRGVS